MKRDKMVKRIEVDRVGKVTGLMSDASGGSDV